MRPVLLFCLTILVAGCGSTPVAVLLQPAVEQQPLRYQAHPYAQLQVRDMRHASYIMAIQQKDKAAQLLHSSASLTQQLQLQLQTGWQQQGLLFLAPSPVTSSLPIGSTPTVAADVQPIQIRVDILELNTDVTQTAMENKAISTLRLKLLVDNQGRRLAKQFRSVKTVTAPLKADPQAIQRIMSRQLSSLLEQILTDQQLQQYLSSSFEENNKETNHA